METVRKRKVAATSENNETVNEEETYMASPTINDVDGSIMAISGDVEPVIYKPAENPIKISLLDDAPTLYGNNPTAQEIEDFKKAELQWRSKLRNL